MGGPGFPPSLQLNTGAYLALWWGLWQTLGGLTPRSTSQNFCCQCPCTQGEPQPPPTSAEDPLTLAGKSGPVSYGVTAPCPGFWCTRYFVCAHQEWSLCFPQSFWSLSVQSASFKVWFSRISSSCFWTPRLGCLTWSSEPSLQWVDFCGISVLQFVSHPPSSYGIWFYCDCTPPTISLCLLLCLWMWDIFFGVFQCLPVDDWSAVVIPVLSQGGESILPSIPPSWNNPVKFS